MARAQPAQDERESTLDGGGPEQRLLELFFRIYKWILSPLLHLISPSRCIYLPTCSEYAYAAVSRFGFVRGSWMALRRLVRCHPWGKGGLDPVPERASSEGRHGRASSRPNQKGTDHLS